MADWLDTHFGLGTLIATAVIVMVIVPLATVLRRIIAKLRRRTPKPRSGTLKVIYEEGKPKFEFVNAVNSTYASG